MFRQLRDSLLIALPDPTVASDAVLTGFRPSQLSEYLEAYWAAPQLPVLTPALVEHFVGEGLPDADRQLMSRQVRGLDAPVPPAPANNICPHLLYAYALENTRAVDVFARVVTAYANGERLPPATAETYRWLRVTEELFFTSPRHHSIRALPSNVRPDPGSIRRNAYYRLLGMDLNHGTENGRPYPFDKPDAANRDFPALFEEFLREVWKAYMNRNNAVGPNATDDAALLLLVQRLREMQNSRRYGGMLSREEFDAVATLSWFHLTLEYNTQIVIDLDAIASSPAERLKSIGLRVGLPPTRADAYFRMADPVSRVLLDIENQVIENVGVPDLYQDLGIYQADMLTIMTQWSIATGRDIKESVGVRGMFAPVGGPTGTGRLGMPSSGGNGASRIVVPG